MKSANTKDQRTKDRDAMAKDIVMIGHDRKMFGHMVLGIHQIVEGFEIYGINNEGFDGSTIFNLKVSSCRKLESCCKIVNDVLLKEFQTRGEYRYITGS